MRCSGRKTSTLFVLFSCSYYVVVAAVAVVVCIAVVVVVVVLVLKICSG